MTLHKVLSYRSPKQRAQYTHVLSGTKEAININLDNNNNSAVLRDIRMDTIELSYVASQTPIPILDYNSHLPSEFEAHSVITAAVNSLFSCIKSHI